MHHILVASVSPLLSRFKVCSERHVSLPRKISSGGDLGMILLRVQMPRSEGL